MGGGRCAVRASADGERRGRRGRLRRRHGDAQLPPEGTPGRHVPTGRPRPHQGPQQSRCGSGRGCTTCYRSDEGQTGSEILHGRRARVGR
ncbi:hypothetical protein HAZT_HAZT009668, partial [Hyalella azteca]